MKYSVKYSTELIDTCLLYNFLQIPINKEEAIRKYNTDEAIIHVQYNKLSLNTLYNYNQTRLAETDDDLQFIYERELIVFKRKSGDFDYRLFKEQLLTTLYNLCEKYKLNAQYSTTYSNLLTLAKRLYVHIELQRNSVQILESIFFNAFQVERCLDILRNLEEPVIDSRNRFIGNHKSIIVVWLNYFANMVW